MNITRNDKLAATSVSWSLHQKRQTRVCLSSSSQFLVSGGLDHCVHIWDLKTKRLHRSLKVKAPLKHPFAIFISHTGEGISRLIGP